MMVAPLFKKVPVLNRSWRQISVFRGALQSFIRQTSKPHLPPSLLYITFNNIFSKSESTAYLSYVLLHLYIQSSFKLSF